MQHVKVGWLKKFNYALVSASALLFITYFLFESLGVSQATKDRWGITPLILGFAAIHAIYVFASNALLMKRQPWVASFISVALYAFLISSIIESSGNTNIAYRAAFIVAIFFTGMLGVYTPITAIVFTWMILIFTITGVATPTEASLTFNVIVDILVTVSGISGWLFFRKYYVASGKESALESQLEEEQFKSSAILESITDGVLVINLKGIIQITNVSAAQMFGWTKDEATNLDYHSLIKPISDDPKQEKAAPDAISEALKSGEATKRVNKLETLNGRQLYVDIIASPIYQNKKNEEGKAQRTLTGIIAVLRDVDKEKRAEQQRSDFISTASHEMRTPVASIQGYLELALNPKIGDLNEKTKGYLNKAYDATKHLGQLFQDLLTVSQTEDGRAINNPKIFDISELLHSLCESVKLQAARKNLQVECSVNQAASDGKTVSPLMYVDADPERIREVLNNLLENAIKYTEQGKVGVQASVISEQIRIAVTDTGPGIPEEDIPHLFQKFYRVDNSATREKGGTGLGLYISKQIVEMFDGKIWVESKLGQGSTFYVELPRVSPEQLRAPKPVQQAQA